MDLNQIVSIPLNEYLELKEIFDHRKEVKITERFEKGNGAVGISVEWRSDGACWKSLGTKLEHAGERIKELVKEKNKIKRMSVWEFLKYRKEANTNSDE